MKTACLALLLLIRMFVSLADDDHVAVMEMQRKLVQDLQQRLSQQKEINDTATDAVSRYSSRGDLRMFLGEAGAAVEDYRRMVMLDPDQDASHWRLGIALFFAHKPVEAADQFDKYHAFDNVDRENGIWRYLSHYRAFGAERARQELLRYQKDDRPPFPEVYRMFEGSLSAEQVLSSIPADLPAPERQSRLFYADLYIGLHLLVQKKPQEAQGALLRAVQNPWPKSAGYGPNYMWHVGRLQYLQLTGTPDQTAPSNSEK